MKKLTQSEIREKLQKHNRWLNGEDGGEKADLRHSDLSDSDLRDSNLRDSNLRDSNLSYSNLRGSDLSDSDLSYSNLHGSDLSYSNLRHSDLRDSNLRDSNLSYSNLRYSDLSDSDLRGSDLSDSDLSYSNLHGSDLDFSCWPLWCGGLNVKIDDRLAIQLLFHTVQNALYSPYVSDDIKRVLGNKEVVDIANRFHRAEVTRIEPYEEDNHVRTD